MTHQERKKLAKILLILYEILNDTIDLIPADDIEQLPILDNLRETRQHVLRAWQEFELTIEVSNPDDMPKDET